MSEEAQSKIFDRFVQADSSTTRKFGGTGLGMSITANLIKMMADTLDVKSTLGVGTKIRVTLPLSQGIIQNAKRNVEAQTPPTLLGKRVLIAEDNEINQLIISTMLEPTQADIVVVENGRMAVDEVMKGDFDVVFMDIQMPIMDGVEAMQEINKRGFTLPVVALTANVMPSDVKRYLALGSPRIWANQSIWTACINC